jgi:hypothetical protein
VDRPYTPLTPGPWRTAYSDTRSAYTITSTTCFRQIAWIRGDSEENRLGEAEANAQLIANAPKLARVLEKIVDDYERFRPGTPRSEEVIDAWSRSVSMARSAILSAFGEEHDEALADLEQQTIAPPQTENAATASATSRVLAGFRRRVAQLSGGLRWSGLYGLARASVPPAIFWLGRRLRPLGRIIARMSGPYGRRAGAWVAAGALRLWIMVGLWRARRHCRESLTHRDLIAFCRAGLRWLRLAAIDGHRRARPALDWFGRAFRGVLSAEASGTQRDPIFVGGGTPLAGRA